MCVTGGNHGRLELTMLLLLARGQARQRAEQVGESELLSLVVDLLLICRLTTACCCCRCGCGCRVGPIFAYCISQQVEGLVVHFHSTGRNSVFVFTGTV